MDFKPGVPLNEVLPELPESKKRDVVAQIADIFVGVQRAPLPAALKGCRGGLTITNEGEIVPGQMTTLEGGPWTGDAELWKTRLRNHLAEADGSEALDGWRTSPDGLRQAVEKFVDSGVDSLMSKAGLDTSATALIHGDFSKVPALHAWCST